MDDLKEMERERESHQEFGALKHLFQWIIYLLWWFLLDIDVAFHPNEFADEYLVNWT